MLPHHSLAASTQNRWKRKHRICTALSWCKSIPRPQTTRTMHIPHSPSSVSQTRRMQWWKYPFNFPVNLVDAQKNRWEVTQGKMSKNFLRKRCTISYHYENTQYTQLEPTFRGMRGAWKRRRWKNACVSLSLPRINLAPAQRNEWMLWP